MEALPKVLHLGRSVDAEHCAVLTDETVRCWSESDGTPTAIADLAEVTQVSGKCALSADGEVRCWGPGGAGQIGNGSTDDLASPQLVEELSAARQIAAGGNHVCAILSDQSLWCWGKDGLFDSIDYGSPPLPIISLGAVVDVAAGHDNTCAVQAITA